MTVYNWIISISWLIFLCYWIISAAHAKKNVCVRSWRWIVLRILIIITIVAVLESKTFSRLDDQYLNTTPNPLVGAIGIVLCALGIAFAIWARVHIGKNWGMPMTVKEELELVTTGPYAYIRHPIYSGALLAMLGTALAIGLWWLIPFVVLAIYFIYSATQEESLLIRQFPNQYSEYRKRTKMFIPFVI